MRTLILLSIFTMSCGDIEIKDNKADVQADVNTDNEETDQGFSYEYEYEYERVSIKASSGGETASRDPEPDCMQPKLMGYMYPSTSDLNQLINDADNVYVAYGECHKVGCPDGYAVPRFDILRDIKDWNMINFGPDSRIWWELPKRTYLPADSQYGSGDYEVAKINMHAHLICLKESAFEHLYTGD